MAEYCLKLGYKVYGMARFSSDTSSLTRLFINPNFKLLYSNVLDEVDVDKAVQSVKPDYFFNFAAQSSVAVSWKNPKETFHSGASGVLNCLEAIRRYAPECRFFNAGSVEAGSPYGMTKEIAGLLVKFYRKSYGIYAVQGNLANCESPRRKNSFFTKKVLTGIKNISNAISNKESFASIKLGNLDVQRYWLHPYDAVDAIWRISNQEKNKLKDYRICSESPHSVRDFVTLALKYANIEGYWVGNGINEKYLLANYILEENEPLSQTVIEIDSSLIREESKNQVCSSLFLRDELGWKPNISFEQLVYMLVDDVVHGKTEEAKPKS